jgi:hypothetical protein
MLQTDLMVGHYVKRGTLEEAKSHQQNGDPGEKDERNPRCRPEDRRITPDSAVDSATLEKWLHGNDPRLIAWATGKRLLG